MSSCRWWAKRTSEPLGGSAGISAQLLKEQEVTKKNTMSKRELVLIVSRGFALLLIAWALLELTYLPERVFSIYHHVGQQSVLNNTHGDYWAKYYRDYWASYYLLVTVMLILRALAEAVAALVFWRCGPRVEALFSKSTGEPS